MALGLTMVGLSGCGQSEIKGHYDVDLRVAGAARAITGELLLGTRPLDLPGPTRDPVAGGPAPDGIDSLGANSCFILDGRALGIEGDWVEVFEARYRGDRLEGPIELLSAEGLRIEVSELQFFAGAIGADLAVAIQGAPRPGRLEGRRRGPASSQACVEAFDRFQAAAQTRLSLPQTPPTPRSPGGGDPDRPAS